MISSHASGPVSRKARNYPLAPPRPNTLPAARRAQRLRVALFCLLTASIAFAASEARSAQLQIQFTGLNLNYDGVNLFDAQFPNTVGSGNPAQSDSLTSMSFYLDGVQVGTLLSSDIYADVYLKDVLNIPVGGGVVNSLGNGGVFGFDLLTSSSSPGWGLALNIDTMQFFYTGSQIAISVAGLASSLSVQQLPFDLEYDSSQPITIVFASAEITGVTSAGGYLTGFNAAGTGNVSGTGHLIPEPTSMSLFVIAAGALATLVARRPKLARMLH